MDFRRSACRRKERQRVVEIRAVEIILRLRRFDRINRSRRRLCVGHVDRLQLDLRRVDIRRFDHCRFDHCRFDHCRFDDRVSDRFVSHSSHLRRFTACTRQQRAHIIDLGQERSALVGELRNARFHFLTHRLPTLAIVLTDSGTQHRFSALVFMRCQLRFEIFNSPFEIIAECRECAYMLAQLLDHANTPRGVVAMNAFENAHRRVRSLRLEGSEPIVVALALGNQCSNIVDGHVAQLLHESPSGVKPV